MEIVLACYDDVDGVAVGLIQFPDSVHISPSLIVNFAASSFDHSLDFPPGRSNTRSQVKGFALKKKIMLLIRKKVTKDRFAYLKELVPIRLLESL